MIDALKTGPLDTANDTLVSDMFCGGDKDGMLPSREPRAGHMLAVPVYKAFSTFSLPSYKRTV